MRFFREFIVSLLEDDLRNHVTWPEHVYSQSSVFYVRTIDFVGKLPLIKWHWRDLQIQLGIAEEEVKEFNTSLGVRESSLDPYGTYRAAKVAVATSAHIKQALCLVLWADYANLNYTLPDECLQLDLLAKSVIRG